MTKTTAFIWLLGCCMVAIKVDNVHDEIVRGTVVKTQKVGMCV